MGAQAIYPPFCALVRPFLRIMCVWAIDSKCATVAYSSMDSRLAGDALDPDTLYDPPSDGDINDSDVGQDVDDDVEDEVDPEDPAAVAKAAMRQRLKAVAAAALQRRGVALSGS